MRDLERSVRVFVVVYVGFDMSCGGRRLRSGETPPVTTGDSREKLEEKGGEKREVGWQISC